MSLFILGVIFGANLGVLVAGLCAVAAALNE